MNAKSLNRSSCEPYNEPSPTVTSICEARAISPFGVDCLDGLSRHCKSLPCKWLYDDAGSLLFGGITTVEEYYPTRAEEGLIEECRPYIAHLLSKPTTLVELGSGASRKTRLLLTATDAITSYIPIEISADELKRAQTSLQAEFIGLAIDPICADFTEPATLGLNRLTGPMLLFFPGSTLGNMAPLQAIQFLRALRENTPADTQLLLGVDLLKDERTLCAAYDDAAGVTAAFNLNLLERINRELEGVIDISAFRHNAVWNAEESRVEMHLEATSRQEVQVLGRRFVIEAGESIHTENSYKLSVVRWQEIFEAAGWQMSMDWQSPPPAFLLALLDRKEPNHDR